MRLFFRQEVIPLLYRIGTQREIPPMRSKLPECAIAELCRCTATLDIEYGAKRNYLESGGYTLILEEAKDLAELRKIINCDTHPCEWANRIGEAGEFISALYLLNDDFSVVVLLPSAIAPDAILKDLED